MPSKKMVSGLGLAGAIGGAAFLGPSSAPSSAPKTTSLRRGNQSAQPSSAAPTAAAGCVVAAGAVLASQVRKAQATSSKFTTALRAFEQELGVQPPVGYWDPLGLARDGDVEAFMRRRSVELKHGRIAMLATMGYITPEIAGKFPGFLSPSMGLKFADVPNGLAAISKVPAGGWTQILLYMGWCEVSRGAGSDIASGRPGDFGWYVLTSADPEEKKKKLNAELANGRLAMMAIIGMFYQDGLTGSAWGDWANFTESPLRAFEQELGVQAPVGFWDPLGLARDGDVEAFMRRRSVELKHGRIAMLATMGYITPEIAGKFPGFLSPSMGLKFADVPNGLAAISKVPAGGWTQILLYMGWCEVSRGAGSDIASGRPGDFGWYVLTSADAEEKKKKLNAELANGRLAMMAIIGMFYQDGLTGSAWGDWANYTESPLRAAPDFTQELGVTPPLGFFDPLGLSKYDNDEIAKQQFRRRRIVELQHGRVAMLACIGYIVPEYVRFPGFCAPSQNLAFTDIPNGLKGAAAVPLAGWLQIITFVGIIEVTNLQSIQTDVLGDYGYGAFGLPFGKKIEDAEKKAKSLNAEINNGRLAMMAIIGMFFQDGLTGSAWGDWANYTDSPLRAAPDFSGELGVTPPLGFFDPLGLSKFDDPQIAAAQFKRRRIIEIQHGRVAMLACIGYIVPEYVRFPGFCAPSQNLAFTDIPNGLKGAAAVPLSGWLQIITFVGIIEVTNLQSIQTDVLGDYGYGAFGLPFGKKIEDAEKKAKSLNAEINNGRLAMFAIIGMFFQDGLTGSAWGDWANYTESPLRAFEEELGVQAPVGFWDPVGYTRDGNVETFKRRRETEIKHGRVAMYATMGYIVPEYFKWPGFLSPSLGLKFSDVPNGLAAITKVPGAGWAQIVAFAGYYELFVYKYSGTPGDYGWKILTSSDPEGLKKKLSAEIANGRLAMMAIIGMFFQDGLTGSAWGDWANYTDSPLRAFEDQPGVQPPVGFWDPLGLSASGNVSDYNRRREVELKHGRVCMFATIGYILPEYWRFPGYLSKYLDIKFSDVPNGLNALSKVPAFGWLQIVGFAGIVELNIYNEQINNEPGNYGAGFLGLRSIGFMNAGIQDPETRKKKLNAELANGRLAMFAIIGMFFQDGLTGSAWGDWALYTGSPLRAFEEELGVQAPVGFWDPVGYTRDGSVETFKRRRETEIKHGRVAMYATLGYIVPEYFKWPGFLSPSLGLKFSDVPNGLAAITKVPGAGWAQIVAFAGYYELFVYKYSGTPGDYGWKVLTSSDPEGLKKKLSAEIANGRLAMMAIIGMFFQDGLTGSAWGDWANYTDSPLRAFEDQTGVQPPVGFWDPLGLSQSGNVSDFNRRREVELKHGRVSMFATIGYILPEYWRFPGYLSKYLDIKFADVPNGLSAFSKVPAFGWLQIVGFAGIVEVNIYNEQINSEPGNYGAGFLGLRSIGVMNTGIEDPETRKKKLNAELANGRLAMMAIIGMFFQDGLTGSAWGDWANYTASPLRAFEEELGVQPPVGFWDPVGYTRDGSVETFKRRRETEIKHGRVAMYATMGYIVPEYFKWPGFLSPSLGLKFSDVPNGLAAISKVPGAGWAQIVAFAGYYELFVYKYSGTPGDYGWKPITSADPEGLKKKLSAELANGRLAMMAIIGMFFQDGLTGSAWGDWANYTDSPLRAFEDQTGVQPPVGFWDPLGLSASGNVSDFKRRREVELKHGRVAMFATIGYILPEYWRFPGYLSKYLDIKFADVPNGLSAFSKVPAFGWLQIVGFAGIVEVNIYNEQVKDEPGNYGAGFLGLRSIGFMNAGIEDPETRKKKLNAELANGRLAMFAIIGMFFQDGLTGSAWGDWSLYTASPLRAFEGELGVQAPVGFWDPLGLSADGDAEVFKRRREVELKHGRISMFATIGYIVPEYFRWPGELSPKLGLKFTDIPNGLAALTKVPGQGWGQIVAFLGTYELFINKPVGDEPGNYGKGNLGLGFLPSVADPEARTRKLSAELANGRLAMMAIIGMLFQDGLTGSAWGDWALYTDSPLRAFEQELGAQPPLGFWDPVGFTKDGSADNFKRRRAVEIKHGRVAMLATMGYITPEIAGKWGGICATDLNFSDIPNGLAALKVVPFAGWLQIFAYCGFVEFSSGLGEDAWGSKKAGDVGWKPPFFSAGDDETKKRRLAAELANGRLAMMAIIGMFFQDGLTGSAWGDWANYTASPLRAFEGELGVQAPVGFWDPLGLSADGDMDTFKRRRAVELKHGRICMLACVGYIIPEYFRWPGYLSPEKGLKFSEMPHGIAAISKVPLEGWLQIVLFIGHYEGYFWRQDAKRAPGDFEGYGFLGVGKNFIINVDPIEFQDADVKKTKLAAELANGRLAMVALMAMLFQNGTVGTTGPAMWLPSA